MTWFTFVMTTIILAFFYPLLITSDVIKTKAGSLPKPDGMGLLLVSDGQEVALACDVFGSEESGGHISYSSSSAIGGSASPNGAKNNLAPVQWHYNTLSNNALKSFNRRLSANGSLIISSFNGLTDTGTYYCSVQKDKNSQLMRFGKSLVLTTRKYLPYLPVIEHGPRDKIALAGDTVRFSCDVAQHRTPNLDSEKNSDSVQTPPKVTWYRDGLPIDSSRGSGSGGGSSGVAVPSKPHAILGSDLMLFYVDGTSVAHYYCVVSSSFFSSSSSLSSHYSDSHLNFSVASQVASLSISSLGEKFRAVPSPLIEGVEGKMVSLSCIAPVGVPEPKVSWLFEQKPIDFTSRPNAVSSSHVTWDGVVRHELNLTNLRIEDEGQYSCLASNPLNRNINVTSAPSWLQIKTGPRFAQQMSELIQYHSNSNLVIKCSAYASPDPPMIRFFFKGERLQNSSRVTITETFRFHTAKDREFRLKEAFLQISNISAASDQGPYKCQALNAVNNITSLTRLEIIANPIQVSCTENIVATVGTDVTFECKIENKNNFPTPTTYWDTPQFGNVFPDENLSDRLRVFSNGTLKLKNVTLEDSGTFICSVLISSEVVQKTATLVVKAINSEPLPVIVLKPRDTTAYEGDNVTLPCEIDMTSVSSLYRNTNRFALATTSTRSKSSPTIKWMKDLKVVYSSDLKGIALQGDGSLRVNNVSKDHEGKYTCLVSNGSGETIASADLVVKSGKNPAQNYATTDDISSHDDDDDVNHRPDEFYLESEPPSAPWVLEVVNSSCLRLTWIAPKTADVQNLYYQIEKYGFGSNMWSWEVERTLAPSPIHTVCQLAEGVEYVFVVRGALSPRATGRASPISQRFKTYDYKRESYHSNVEQRVKLMKQQKLSATLSSTPFNTTAIWVSWKITGGENIPSGYQLRIFEYHASSRQQTSASEIPMTEDVALSANRRSYIFGQLRPSFKYKITLQPHVVGLLGPIADYTVAMTHYEVPSTPPSSIEVVKNITLGQLTITWDPPIGTPSGSLTGYRVTLFDPDSNTIIKALTFDNSTNEVSIASSNPSEDVYGSGRQIGVYVQAQSPAGLGPRSQPIIVDMSDGSTRSNKGGFLVPLEDRNWMILTLGGSIWISLLLLLGVLYFKFRRDKLTHSIQPYYIHAMHPSSKCSANNEQLDQDIYPASISCHQQHHMAPLVIKTGNGGGTAPGSLHHHPLGDQIYSRSERNSMSASTHYTHLGSNIFQPNMSNTMPGHGDSTGSQILNRNSNHFFGHQIGSNKLGTIAIFPTISSHQRNSPLEMQSSSPATSPRSSAAFSATPGNTRYPSGASAGHPLAISLHHQMSPSGVALYTSPTGSSAPGSLYAEVTDYHAYLPTPQDQFSPCPQCSDPLTSKKQSFKGSNENMESQFCSPEEDQTSNNHKLPCTCSRVPRYPPNAGIFPMMGLGGGHVSCAGGGGVAPGGVLISRVHPMQHRSVIGVATNGSYLKSSNNPSSSGRGSSSGGSACGGIGGGGHSGKDMSHEIDNSDSGRVPVMYYANISNQPQSLQQQQFASQVSCQPLLTNLNHFPITSTGPNTTSDFELGANNDSLQKQHTQANTSPAAANFPMPMYDIA